MPVPVRIRETVSPSALAVRFTVAVAALVAARVHRRDRNVVESARGDPREPEGYSLVGRWARRRGRNLEKEGAGTGSARGSVVDAIGRQIRQRASVGIRGRSRP